MTAAYVRLLIAAADGGRSVETDVVIGQRLIDICDELAAPVLFSCRAANCGVCRVRVTEGAKCFTHPTAEEAQVLSIFEASSGERLACQLVIAKAAGPIRLVAMKSLPEADDNL